MARIEKLWGTAFQDLNAQDLRAEARVGTGVGDRHWDFTRFSGWRDWAS